MELLKWNYQQKKYEPYEIPDNWNVPLMSVDLEDVINCASCGREILFGDGYTSRMIHTKHGIGYYVCHDCYEQEWKEQRKWI